MSNKTFIDNRDLSSHTGPDGYRRIHPIIFDVSDVLVKNLDYVTTISEYKDDAVIIGKERNILALNKSDAKKILKVPNVRIVNERKPYRI
jgi:hypothetical protein